MMDVSHIQQFIKIHFAIDVIKHLLYIDISIYNDMFLIPFALLISHTHQSLSQI